MRTRASVALRRCVTPQKANGGRGRSGWYEAAPRVPSRQCSHVVAAAAAAVASCALWVCCLPLPLGVGIAVGAGAVLLPRSLESSTDARSVLSYWRNKASHVQLQSSDRMAVAAALVHKTLQQQQGRSTLRQSALDTRAPCPSTTTALAKLASVGSQPQPV